MYAPNFLDSYDRLVAFDAETTGKHTPSAEFIRRQPCAWKPPGVIIEIARSLPKPLPPCVIFPFL